MSLIRHVMYICTKYTHIQVYVTIDGYIVSIILRHIMHRRSFHYNFLDFFSTKTY